MAEEDFGISMVEALASGMPVLALPRGGATDIVRPGEDGLFIDRPDLDSLRTAIREIATSTWDPDSLAARAEKFSRPRFVERFSEFMRGLADRQSTSQS